MTRIECEPKSIEKGERLDDRRTISRVRNTLMQLLDPITGFALDSGFGSRELEDLVREIAIKNVAARQLQSSNRLNISGISATTGISRAEIARVLRPKDQRLDAAKELGRPSIYRVIDGWNRDPKFARSKGNPADLSIFGREQSFDKLVQAYGAGIPTRAMVEELLRIGAVELLEGQKLRTTKLVSRARFKRTNRIYQKHAIQLITVLFRHMSYLAKSRDDRGTVDAGVIPINTDELSRKCECFLAEILGSLEVTKGVDPRKKTARDSIGLRAKPPTDSSLSKHDKPNGKRINFRRA